MGASKKPWSSPSPRRGAGNVLDPHWPTTSVVMPWEILHRA